MVCLCEERWLDIDRPLSAAWAAGSPEQACRDLVALANKRWHEEEEEEGVVDDITAVIIWFKPEVSACPCLPFICFKPNVERLPSPRPISRAGGIRRGQTPHLQEGEPEKSKSGDATEGAQEDSTRIGQLSGDSGADRKKVEDGGEKTEGEREEKAGKGE